MHLQQQKQPHGICQQLQQGGAAVDMLAGAPAKQQQQVVATAGSAHSKTRAIRAAARAVRPRSAITGLGERACALAAGAGAAKSPQQQHSTRPCTADAAVPKGPRDIWPQDLQQKHPRFCVGCRGEHTPQNERNPDWQPYTPLQRYQNLGILESKFQTAYRQGKLPLALTGCSEPVRWLGATPQGKAMKPVNLDDQLYKRLLPLSFEGIREGHQPYRYLASQAALDLLAAAAYPSAGSAAGTQQRTSAAAHAKQQCPRPQQAQWLLEVLPEVVAAVRAGLNTMQPSLAAHIMLMLQQLLQTNSSVGPALVPHYKHLLPAMVLLLRHGEGGTAGMSKRLLLPPPYCLPPVGSFTGGDPPSGSPNCCSVCGAAFGSALQTKARQQQPQQHHHKMQHPQGGVCGCPAQPDAHALPLFGGETPAVHARAVIKQRRASIMEVVDETLQLLAAAGGSAGLSMVKRYCPTFEYCNPQD